ncbi:MAG: acetyl-CoA carboxylase biotin carboxyl carrier protein [Egibacteraceae bacterium]
MTDDKPAGDALVRSLCEEARTLASGLRGPLSKISISAGDHQVEVVWHEATGGAMVVPAHPGAAPDSAVAEEDTEGRHVIVAPLVGTFYRSPDPSADPFVEEGDEVEAGADVGIIEAMKIMNNIQAEQAGTITKILVSDGEMVEFGQELMVIEPAGEAP